MRIYAGKLPDDFEPLIQEILDTYIEIGYVGTDCFLDPRRVSDFEDFPAETLVEPKDLIGDADDILFLSRVNVADFFDHALGHYWDIASLGYDFHYTCLHGSFYDYRGIFFGEENFTILVFKFDSKAHAVLAKLSLLESRIISDEVYRGLLGKTRQSSFDIPL